MSARPSRRAVWLALAACWLACATPPEPSAPSGFLGDYARLGAEAGAGERQQGARVFIDPAADFGRYDDLVLDPVSVWLEAGAGIDAELSEDLERLADRLEEALRRHLAQDFALVERPGPRSLRLRVGISQSVAAEDRLAGAVSRPGRSPAPDPEAPLAPRTAAFLEAAALEVEALDALANRRLAAAADPGVAAQRLEGSPLLWQDAERAWDAWADGLQAALAAFRRSARAGPRP